MFECFRAEYPPVRDDLSTTGIRIRIEAADLVIADPYGTGQIGMDAYTQDYSRRRSDLFGNVRQTRNCQDLWIGVSRGLLITS